MPLLQIPWSVFNKDNSFDLSPILKPLSPIDLEIKFIKGISVLRINFQKTNLKFAKKRNITQKDSLFYFSSVVRSLSKDNLKRIRNLTKNEINLETKIEKKNLIKKFSVLINLSKLKYNYRNYEKADENLNNINENKKYLVSNLINLFLIFRASGSIVIKIEPIKSTDTLCSNFSILLEIQLKLLKIGDSKSEKESYNTFKGHLIKYLDFHQFSYRFHRQNLLFTALSKFNYFFRDQLKNTLFSFSETNKYFLKYSDDLLSKCNVSEQDKEFLNKFHYFSEDKINDVGDIPIGFKIDPKWFPKITQYITKSDLASHISCFGLTSQGKSRFIYNLLHQFSKSKIHFLIFDSKGEYMQSFSNNEVNIHYYKIGSKTFNLFLNIFATPYGLEKEDHYNFLYSLFLHIVGESTTPQMLRILYQALRLTVIENGNFKKFINYIENPKLLGIQGAYLELSVAGLMNRIQPLISGISGTCFNVEYSNINYDLLMNKDVIIDLSLFEETENNITRKTLVNVVYYYFINYVRKTRGKIRNPDSIKNVIVVEEAQKLVPVNYNGKNELNTPLGMSTWTARAYGVSMLFVGTDPVVESSVITNTGVTILFYGKYEDYKISRLLNISNEQFSKLVNLLTERQHFLFCNKGEIQLCRSFNYNIPSKESTAYQYLKFIRKDKKLE